MRKITLFIAIALLPLFACSPPIDPADFVILGGTVITMNSAQPYAEGLAARGQRILAVGSEDEIRAFVGPETEVLNLDGAVAYPGFIDAHAHFLAVGKATMELNLREAESWADIVDLVAEAVDTVEPGTWIRGRGWHQEKWLATPEPSLGGLPVHNALSAVSQATPVFLTHASGHAAMVNAKAMELAWIDRYTPDPPGGEIVRDAEGSAIGVLRERAEELVTNVMPNEDSEKFFRRRVEYATRECLSKGITSFQDAASTLIEARRLRAMAEAGKLELRLWLMLSEPNEIIGPELDRVRVVGAGDGFLTIRGIKRFIDGALGSHGAWLLEPYADLPTTTGLNTENLEAMKESARLADAHGFQFCVHAIGDRANRETLNVFEATFADRSKLREMRWRIEHAQHLHIDDIPRFGELGVIASIQPVHCTSDGPWVPQRLGEDRSREGAYVWRSLLDSGAHLAAGTDAPVEDIDPLATFRAAVTRLKDDGLAFYPGQCLTREEALRAMTLDAAWAAFEEDEKGSLEVGKFADVTILSGNLLEVPLESLAKVRVISTVVGGQVRFTAQD
ncbi:MAG: amidohydrolase [Thermoanaerobaculales bacterium]|nr:amidohydrolase [Thermoanaerobaculales bacterium]